MKKNNADILFICLFLVIANCLAEYVQYSILMSGFSFIRTSALFLGLGCLYFIISPYLNHRYDDSVRKMLQGWIPKQRMRLGERFAWAINNLYYSSEYIDDMHLNKTAASKCRSYVESKYRLLRFMIQLIIYSGIYIFVNRQWPHALAYGLLVLSGFMMQYWLANKQINFFLTNVEDDRIAEYYRNILCDPAIMHDIKMYKSEGKIARLSIAAFGKGLDKRYALRHKNAVFYPLIKAFMALGISLFLAGIVLGGKSDIGSIAVTVSCLLKAAALLEPAAEALFEFRTARGILRKSEQSPKPASYNKHGGKLAAIESIQFKDVSFGYGSGKKIIDSMNFTWNLNESISIIGENGAGKTTFIKLLLGINKPDSGAIYVNGIPLEELDYSDYIAKIGSCLQEFGQFEESVSGNILLGRRGCSNHKDNRHIKRLMDFAASLPDGLDTHLGANLYADGTELSYGQWQRIALCRAICGDSALLVLDEPTSAMDSFSEKDFYETFAVLSESMPAMLITHRIGFARLSSRICVMSAGKMVEEGTHDELMSLGGVYARMFENQKSMFNGEAKE